MKTITDTLNLAPQGRNFLTVDRSAPVNVKTFTTTCNGGASEGMYRSLNVGSHVGDNLQAVLRNRETVQEQVDLSVTYLNQICDTIAVNVVEASDNTPDADVSVDTTGAVACASMTADYLSILLCGKVGVVAVTAHMSWRGLIDGVLQDTAAAMKAEPLEIMTCLALVIGPGTFEAGRDTFDAFCAPMPEAVDASEDVGGGKYFTDIYALVRMVLHREGVNMIYSDTRCTVLKRDTSFSYHRDGQTGHMVSLIWLEK